MPDSLKRRSRKNRDGDPGEALSEGRQFTVRPAPAEKDGVQRCDVGGVREISDPRASWLLRRGCERRNEHGSQACDEGATVHSIT
jgi:hypothetical protein